jgi:hypothetical protein
LKDDITDISYFTQNFNVDQLAVLHGLEGYSPLYEVSSLGNIIFYIKINKFSLVVMDDNKTNQL